VDFMRCEGKKKNESILKRFYSRKRKRKTRNRTDPAKKKGGGRRGQKGYYAVVGGERSCIFQGEADRGNRERAEKRKRHSKGEYVAMSCTRMGKRRRSFLSNRSIEKGKREGTGLKRTAAEGKKKKEGNVKASPEKKVQGSRLS